MEFTLRQLKCFVASAFDKTDTDLLFSKVISPALKKMKIIPRVVNRIEHNENIDQKIVALLTECDFAISDLTYARPSVYYEAGFAERIVPVIYTARKDHFRQKDNDPHGNLCIHFDLQKKNVIPWAINSFPAAKVRLLKRIKYVIRPIQLRHEKQAEIDRQSFAFQLLSQQDKLGAIRRNFYSYLLKAGYHTDIDHFGNPNPNSDLSRIKDGTLVVIESNFRLKANKRLLEDRSSKLRDFHDLPKRHRNEYLDGIKPRTIRRIRVIRFVFSLRKTPNTTLHDACWQYQISSNPDHVFQIVPKQASNFGLREELHICLVDGLKNEKQFVDQAISFLKTISTQRYLPK